jgi:thioester reductase-like protein
MPDHILLTGATGLLGQYLLRDLLRAGEPVAVLARSRNGTSAKQRVERLLSRWNEPLPSPVCLEGDINTPGLGLNCQELDWAAHHCRRMLHCAASLSFRSLSRDEEPYKTNLGGAENVLNFCQRARIRQLHHVSTAYLCGLRGGTIRENELDCGQGFRNDYERSKFEAEKLVRSAGVQNLTVYRPAVIVGDSRTGYTETYHGLYAYLHFVAILKRASGAEGRWSLPVRLTVTGEEGRNLVPVDWVSAVMAHLVRTPSAHGKTYHLTPTRATTAREIENAMSSFFNYEGVTFVGPNGLEGTELSDFERLFYDQVALYQPYWDSDPVFCSENTQAAARHLPCPTIDQALLHRLMAFAVEDNWGKRRR